MSGDRNPLWFGVYGKEFQGSEPAFFDDGGFAWARVLRENFPMIRQALAPLMEADNGELKPYFDEALQYPPRNWKTIGFYFWGKKDHDNLERFPEIAALLSGIPGLVSASFNMLEPHSRILPHFGDTNAVYRVHLGIKVPAPLPACGFTVKGESRSWEEGGLLVFLDANVHEAFNDSGQRRYILLLDIIRPEFESRKKQVCIKVLSMLSLYFLIVRTPFFPAELIRRNVGRIPRWVISLLLAPLQLVWHLYLPIQQRINVRKALGISR